MALLLQHCRSFGDGLERLHLFGSCGEQKAVRRAKRAASLVYSVAFLIQLPCRRRAVFHVHVAVDLGLP